MKKVFKIAASMGLTAALVLISSMIFSQEWEVPQDRSERLSPFEFSESSIAEGKNIYSINCISCHGTPGQNNYQALVPPPGDPATEKIQQNPDGSLFFKISEGRGLMPSFRNVLSAPDIWNVISYIRSFNPDYIQSVAVVQQIKDLKWSVIKIMLSHSPEENLITAALVGLEDNNWTPVPNAEIVLSAKRTFGYLQLDEPKITDDEGIARFEFPADLPGNREGILEISARLTDEEVFGTITSDTTLQAAVLNDAPSLVARRAMWNRVSMAPVWLLIAFPAAVLTVWIFIFVVLFKVRAIYLEGEEDKGDD